MSSEYIKKLENILEGVENYRFDDANVDEWKELTTNVLKGAIAREKANKEADELANSIWDRLESRGKELPEPKLNENQEIVLEWLKNQYLTHYRKAPLVLLAKFGWSVVGYEMPIEIQHAYRLLKSLESLEVLQAFATWAIDQC